MFGLVSTLNVLNLKHERLVHNSAKVVPLQVFSRFLANLVCCCRVHDFRHTIESPHLLVNEYIEL